MMKILAESIIQINAGVSDRGPFNFIVRPVIRDDARLTQDILTESNK